MVSNNLAKYNETEGNIQCSKRWTWQPILVDSVPFLPQSTLGGTSITGKQSGSHWAYFVCLGCPLRLDSPKPLYLRILYVKWVRPVSQWVQHFSCIVYVCILMNDTTEGNTLRKGAHFHYLFSICRYVSQILHFSYIFNY